MDRDYFWIFEFSSSWKYSLFAREMQIFFPIILLFFPFSFSFLRAFHVLYACIHVTPLLVKHLDMKFCILSFGTSILLFSFDAIYLVKFLCVLDCIINKIIYLIIGKIFVSILKSFFDENFSHASSNKSSQTEIVRSVKIFHFLETKFIHRGAFFY